MDVSVQNQHKTQEGNETIIFYYEYEKPVH